MIENNLIEPEWAHVIPNDQWAEYLDAIGAVRETGVPFLLGGAFGLARYIGRWRNTKDLDFFVLPQDKETVVQALTKIGFQDYFSTLPYDRGWIYRAIRHDVIVDTIWQTPNRRSEVDPEWLKRKRQVLLRNEVLDVIPAEELLVIKLYVLQRDRCDWPDLINLLYFTASSLDWEHVIDRMDAEVPLLRGLMQIFDWIAPSKAAAIPQRVRERLGLIAVPPDLEPQVEQERVRLLDSRGWFAAYQPADRPMTLK